MAICECPVCVLQRRVVELEAELAEVRRQNQKDPAASIKEEGSNSGNHLRATHLGA